MSALEALRSNTRAIDAAAIAAALCLPAGAAAQSCVSPGTLDAVSAAAAGAPRANADDTRFVLPRERAVFKLFDHVGAVSINDKLTQQRWRKSGSGMLISGCHVLTSYHVVFPDLAQFTPARKVTFSFGASNANGRAFKYSIEGTPVDLGLFNPQRPVHLLDQLLIRLRQRAPAEYQNIEFGDVDPKEFGAAEVYACGYPGEMNLFTDNPQPLYCDRCQVKGYHYLRGYETNCAMPAGTSGGAVFRMVKDAACDPELKVALVGAPNQSPEPELFPKNHPRIRSFVTDYKRTLAAIKRVIDQDDCDSLSEARARGPTMYGYR